MRPLSRALAATVIALTATSPSGAVVDGRPDTTHPYVGILFTQIEGERAPVCSGFLVSPTVFVTAGHCVAALGGVLPAFVSFDRALTPDSEPLPGRAVPNPRFGSAGPNSFDIAAVLLDEEVTDRGHARLPATGMLDSVPRNSALTVVGYGANGRIEGGGRPTLDFQLVRSFAGVRLVKPEKGKSVGHLRMSNGICFGDSGGPVLSGNSDVAVGINSFVLNRQCAGNAFAYRLDMPEALGFLAPYL